MALSFSAYGKVTDQEGMEEGPGCTITQAESQNGTLQWPGNGLKKALCSYWQARFSGSMRASFEKEVPYFQFVVHPEKYTSFVQKMHPFTLDKLEIYRIKSQQNPLFTVDMHVWHSALEKKSEKMFVRDRWVRFEEQWYHIIRNRIFFPEVY